MVCEINLAPDSGARLFVACIVPGPEQVEAEQSFIHGHATAACDALISEGCPKRIDLLVVVVAGDPRVPDVSLYGLTQVVSGTGVCAPVFEKLDELSNDRIRRRFAKRLDELTEDHFVRPNVEVTGLARLFAQGPCGPQG